MAYNIAPAKRVKWSRALCGDDDGTLMLPMASMFGGGGFLRVPENTRGWAAGAEKTDERAAVMMGPINVIPLLCICWAMLYGVSGE